jgi:hypothetical protein
MAEGLEDEEMSAITEFALATPRPPQRPCGEPTATRPSPRIELCVPRSFAFGLAW